MKAIDRRNAIVDILCKRKQAHVNNLAFELQVDRSTILRDIELLSLSYPIYTVSGNGGGVFIDDNYRLRSSKLSAEQVSVLEKAMATLSIKDSQVLKSIIEQFGGKRV